MPVRTGQAGGPDDSDDPTGAGGALTAPVLDPLAPELTTAYHRATMAAAVYLDRRLQTAKSRRTMEAALNTLPEILTDGRATARTCPWAALQYEHTVGLPGQLAERALTQGELIALFHACGRDPAPAGRRDAAIIALLYGCGLRRSEIPPLQLADFNPETGALVIRHGKGNKARVVYVAGGARAALDAWLDVRTGATVDEFMFLPITRHHRVILRRLSDQAVYDVLRKHGDEAKLRDAFSPHDFRRTFMGDLLDARADIAVVQRLAGHANVQTTARYDRRGEKAKADAAARLHVPFTR